MKENNVIENAELFSLELFTQQMHSTKVDKKSPILISNLPGVPFDTVRELEKLGIYDSKDFFKVLSDLRLMSVFSDSNLSLIQSKIKEWNGLQKLKLGIDLPANYCVLSTLQDAQDNCLVIYWNGLLLSLQNPSSQGWINIKQRFEFYLQKQGFPTLVSNLGGANYQPNWIYNITDFTTFLVNFPPMVSLDDYCARLGFRKSKKSCLLIDKAKRIVLQMVFLLNMVKNKQNTIEVIA